MPGAVGKKHRVSQRTMKEVPPVRLCQATTTTRRKSLPLSLFADHLQKPIRWKYTVDRRSSPSAADASISVAVHSTTPDLRTAARATLTGSSRDTSNPSRAIIRAVVNALMQEKKLLEAKLAAVNLVFVCCDKELI
jgi:hypothetical protein